MYILKRNFRFAKELKCDRFAVSTNADYNNYLESFKLVGRLQQQRLDYMRGDSAINNLLDENDEVLDRFNALAARSKSRFKRILANACFSILIIAVFLASYMVIVLPAFWVPPDAQVTDDFMEEYTEGEGIFRPDERVIIDNGDGTFSLYLDGQLVAHVDVAHGLFNILPIRSKEVN